jgi:hypothetical protein
MDHAQNLAPDRTRRAGWRQRRSVRLDIRAIQMVKAFGQELV